MYVICCFSLAAFNICSFCLIFVNLINMCLWVFCLGFILFGTLWVSWTWVAISFPILGKFSNIISFNIFSCLFFWSSSFQTPMIQMLGFFTLSQRSLRLFVLISFNSFFFFPLCFIYFHHSVFHLTYPIFCLCYSTVGSLQSVFYLLLHYSLLMDSSLFLLCPC